MIMPIVIGVLSGLSAFAIALMIVAGVSKKDKTREWLEPLWQKSLRNHADQAAALERIADILEARK